MGPHIYELDESTKQKTLRFRQLEISGFISFGACLECYSSSKHMINTAAGIFALQTKTDTLTTASSNTNSS